MTLLRKWLPDLLAVLLFAVLAFAYFFPADIEGRILYRHDASAGRGAGQEASEYVQKTGERSRWTNALFGGMPTYQMAPSYKSTDKLSTMTKIYHLFLPENVWFVFAYLLGFYILLRAFDFRQHLAALGSIMWAFSTYFLIIIAAGHIWKVWALAYLPPLIGGLVLAYRGKYLWGFVLTAIFTAFEVNANHVQMTYYYLFIILAMGIAWLVDAIRKKTYVHFAKATGVCIAGAAIGVCINLSNLYHTWQYGQESMRGKSELVKKNAANQTDSGLERDYITGYSYGISETWSLLIPNVKGGASDRSLGDTPQAKEEGDSHFLSNDGQQIPYSYIYNQMPMYWNESTLDRQQPGTSGPVYVGAFVMFLFVLGLFIVKGPMKWALLFTTVLSIMLSWGQNFMGLTDFFIDYVPMYAKFRTVESILVIAEFSIPLLAMLSLKRVIDEPELLSEKKYAFYASTAMTAGILLLFAIMPTMFFNFTTAHEVADFNNMLGSQAEPFLDNLQKVRQSIFTSDCWRSFFIIVFGIAMLLLYKAKKLKAVTLAGLLIAVTLFDLWQVNKRYLNDEMFVPESEREAPQQMSQTDELILRDKTLDYRVLNLASNTFNENETSYYHKSIGGYHAAKLRRYQEMIEQYISPEMQALAGAIAQAGGDMTQVNGDSICPVLNMLNTRYIIYPLQGEQTVPIQNPYALGNAWFVDKVTYAKNANEEIEQVGRIDLRHEAVADEKFKAQLGESTTQDTASVVTIKSYEPNQLTYEVNSGKGGVVVFSEIYYPGWTATIDGEAAELGRVDYLLRALAVKPGKHEVVLSFFPKSVDVTETIAYAAYGVLLLVLAVMAVMYWRRKKA